MERSPPRTIRVAEGKPNRAIGLVNQLLSIQVHRIEISAGVSGERSTFTQLIEIDMTFRECLPAIWAGNYWSYLTVISILVGRLCGRPDFG